MSDPSRDDEVSHGPERWDRPAVELPTGLLDAPALALAAFVTATLSLFGAALFSGYAYVGSSAFLNGDGGDQAVAQLVGVGLAGLPLVLGLLAARSAAAHAAWVGAVARAAVLLAVTSATLRLVVLVVGLATDGPPSGRFF